MVSVSSLIGYSPHIFQHARVMSQAAA